MLDALSADLHKPKLEGIFELAGITKDALNYIKNLREWSQPDLVRFFLMRGR